MVVFVVGATTDNTQTKMLCNLLSFSPLSYLTPLTFQGSWTSDKNLSELRTPLNLLVKILFTTTDVKPESILKAQQCNLSAPNPLKNSLLSAVTHIIQIAAHLSDHLTWRGPVAKDEAFPLT